MKRFLVLILAASIFPVLVHAAPAEAASAKARAMARTLMAAPGPGLRTKRFSLHTIKRRHDIRRHLRGVDIDSINFRFNSTIVDPSQAWKLSDIAEAIHILLRRNPYEVFLIEGHTDAVGSMGYNQRLSERRARSVLRVLARRYGVPHRAMTSAGYGETYLKIHVPYEERRNRRVTARRVTDVLINARSAPPSRVYYRGRRR